MGHQEVTVRIRLPARTCAPSVRCAPGGGLRCDAEWQRQGPPLVRLSASRRAARQPAGRARGPGPGHHRVCVHTPACPRPCASAGAALMPVADSRSAGTGRGSPGSEDGVVQNKKLKKFVVLKYGGTSVSFAKSLSPPEPLARSEAPARPRSLPRDAGARVQW